MQYLWTFVGNGAPKRRPNNYARYRIRRYLYALSQVQLGQEQIQHIDLGCGGGTFAHALLERCISEGVSLRKVRLYSYDYSKKMIKAAKVIHQLTRNQHTQNIPNLKAYSKYKKLLRAIPTKPKGSAHYIITMGYVLANNHSSDAIRDYTNIVKSILCSKARSNQCSLIVYDSNTVRSLAPAYTRLAESLQGNGVNVNTRKNTLNSNELRIAELRSDKERNNASASIRPVERRRTKSLAK